MKTILKNTIHFIFIIVFINFKNLSFASNRYIESEKIFLEYGAMSIADFDGDGFEELVGTTFNSFSNSINHSPHCKEQTTYKSPACDISLLSPNPENFNYSPTNGRGHPSRDMRFYDFDNDGYLDAIINVYPDPERKIRHYEDAILLFWGTPDGGFVLDMDFLSKGYRGKGETIVVADFNNDGLLEIFIPQYTTGVTKYSRNLLFKNLGKRKFQEIAVSAGLVNNIPKFPEGAQAVDLNNDGCIDLYTNNLFFFNDCKINFVDVTKELGLPGTFDEGAIFFDYDNDGDLDFITHHPNLGPSLYENKNLRFSKVNFFPKKEYTSSFGVSAGDVNGDEFDDIIVAGGGSDVKKPPTLFIYSPNGYIEYELNINTFQKNWSDLVLISDLNHDGANDIVARVGSQRIILINPNRPNLFIDFSLLSNGIKNQQGRVIDVEYPNKTKKRYVIDGGSGFLSNKTYNIKIPNNTNGSVKISYYCMNSEKPEKRSFFVSHGKIIVDCILEKLN